MYQKLYRQGYFAYAAMLVLALVFYKERNIFLDNAYHLFVILTGNDFAIQNHRYGAMLTQVFPLLCFRMLAPLDVTMLVYSACFPIYYALCYWLCGSVLKQPRMALVLLLFNVLFVAHSFYWMLSELPQGIAFAMVLFSYLYNREQGKVSVVSAMVLLLFMWAVNFFHPTLVFPLMFAFAFLFFDKEDAGSKKLIFVSAVVFGLMYIVKRKIFVSLYDNSTADRLRSLKTLFPDYFSLKSNARFLELCLNTYYWIPVCLAAIVWVYILRKKPLKLLLFAGAFFGYLLMINVMYSSGTDAAFYIENLYLPLGLILAFPFVFDVLPALERKGLVQAVMLAILVTGCARIYFTHDMYTRSLNWKRDFLSKNIDKKLLIASSKVPADTLIMTWGTAYEFWLLSTAEYGRTSSIIVVDSTAKYIEPHWENAAFITNWGIFPYSAFSPTYFKFKDTVSSYTIVE